MARIGNCKTEVAPAGNDLVRCRRRNLPSSRTNERESEEPPQVAAASVNRDPVGFAAALGVTFQ